MTHCWKSHVMAQLFSLLPSYCRTSVVSLICGSTEVFEFTDEEPLQQYVSTHLP